MKLLPAFVIFIISMVLCLTADVSILVAMLAGLVCFAAVGCKNGFRVKELMKMSADAVRESMIVIEIMFLIGLITAIWRASGTITFFVYYGISIITPSLFILTAFLLCCLLSYILGTSFGVAGTLGVIIMVLARSGGVNEAITAGAVISGVYFGDRNSPVSSSAILVANITKTHIYDNVKLMFKTSLLPMIIIAVAYGILSVFNPLMSVDKSILQSLQGSFSISPWTVIPAAFMLILPLFKVGIVWVFVSSILSGFFVTFFVQGIGVTDILVLCIRGYQAADPNLADILDGGGIVSMLTVCGVILISAAYSGMFQGTDMLGSLQQKISELSLKFGRFAVMLVSSTLVTCIFCNQTIASMMSRDLLTRVYEEEGASTSELAMDIENSSIVLCGLVPWAVSCSVPLSMLGVGYRALIFSFLLYGIPFCYLFTKSWFFKQNS